MSGLRKRGAGLPKRWATPVEVREWIEKFKGGRFAAYAENFEKKYVDGERLRKLREDELTELMGGKQGASLVVWRKLHPERLKREVSTGSLRKSKGKDKQGWRAEAESVAATVVQRRWRVYVAQKRLKEMKTQAAHRYRVMQEMVATERTYVQGIEMLVKYFARPLRSGTAESAAEENKKYARLLTKEQHRIIFGQLEIILGYNKNLLECLEKHLAEWHPNLRISGTFKTLVPFLRTYSFYVENYPAAVQLLTELAKKKDWRSFERKAWSSARRKGEMLANHLITPVQRVPRYEMLLRDLLRKTWCTHPDYEGLAEQMREIQKTATQINEHAREAEKMLLLTRIADSLDVDSVPFSLVMPGRRLIREEYLQYTIDPQNLDNLKPAKLLLFSDVLLTCEVFYDTSGGFFGDIPSAASSSSVQGNGDGGRRRSNSRRNVKSSSDVNNSGSDDSEKKSVERLRCVRYSMLGDAGVQLVDDTMFEVMADSHDPNKKGVLEELFARTPSKESRQKWVADINTAIKTEKQKIARINAVKTDLSMARAAKAKALLDARYASLRAGRQQRSRGAPGEERSWRRSLRGGVAASVPDGNSSSSTDADSSDGASSSSSNSSSSSSSSSSSRAAAKKKVRNSRTLGRRNKKKGKGSNTAKLMSKDRSWTGSLTPANRKNWRQMNAQEKLQAAREAEEQVATIKKEEESQEIASRAKAATGREQIRDSFARIRDPSQKKVSYRDARNTLKKK